MKKLLQIVILMVFVGQGNADPILTTSFDAYVTKVIGKPFGFTVPLNTPVVVSLSYDQSLSPKPNTPLNVERFESTILDGFTTNVLGLTVSSSEYVIDNVDGVFGGIDHFIIMSDSDYGDFRVNGNQAYGFSQWILLDYNRTMFTTSNLSILPTIQQINQAADSTYGIIGEDSYNYIEFRNVVPVPPAVILGGLGLTFSGWLLKKRRMV